MSTYGSFKNSEPHEKQGVTLDLDNAGKFQVARAGGSNKRYQKRLEALLKPHRRAIQTGTLTNEKAEALLIQAYAETVVLGWEGVTGPEGEDVLYSLQACIKLLTDLPDLFAEIRQAAENAALYREVVLEEDSGNLPASSSTS